MEEFYTSYTKMDTYKSCPQEYKYKYIDKLDSKFKKRPLYVGTDIHKLIEQYYLYRTPELLNDRKEAYIKFSQDNVNELALDIPSQAEINTLDDNGKAYYDNIKKLKDKQREMYGDTLTWRDYLVQFIKPTFDNMLDTDKAEIGLTYIEDLARILAQYEYYYTRDNLKILDLEHDKQCSLGTYNGKETQLTFICDALIVLPDVKNYLMEHKTYSKDPMTFEQTWLNTQTAIYVSALSSMYNMNIEGVLWDNIKSIAPSKPNILKNGTYGKQPGTVTLFSFIDYDTIMQGEDAVVNFMNNLPEEIKALGVENNYNNFLSRHITKFNDKAVDSILKDTSTVLGEITKDEPTIYRNMGWTCNGCAYKDLCRQEMLGQDLQFLIDSMFIKRGK